MTRADPLGTLVVTNGIPGVRMGTMPGTMVTKTTLPVTMPATSADNRDLTDPNTTSPATLVAVPGTIPGTSVAMPVTPPVTPAAILVTPPGTPEVYRAP